MSLDVAQPSCVAGTLPGGGQFFAVGASWCVLIRSSYSGNDFPLADTQLRVGRGGSVDSVQTRKQPISFPLVQAIEHTRAGHSLANLTRPVLTHCMSQSHARHHHHHAAIGAMYPVA